jgi:transglutaminase-like putative cysteine protease
MPHFLIRHVTRYDYRQPVLFGEHRMMFRPRESADQHTVRAALDITPTPVNVGWAEDASGNIVGRARFGKRGRELRFVSDVSVEQAVFDEGQLALPAYAALCPFSYGAEEMPDLARFMERQYPDPERTVDRWVRGCLDAHPDRATWPFLQRLNATIFREFAYLRRDEPGIQSPVETLARGRGTCRDFAVFMAEAARALGLAARFVSGYLYVGQGGSGVHAGGSTHAWLQIYLPEAGWIDFDPTSGSVGNRDLVRVAAARNPREVAPLTGSFLGFPSDYIGMSVEVDVRLSEKQAGEGAVPPPEHEQARQGRAGGEP